MTIDKKMLYSTYYLSENSIYIRPCNNWTLSLSQGSGCNYTCVLCYKNLNLLGTGTMTQTTTGIQLNIDFACTTTANVLLNANGTFGSITITQPAWQNPITQTILFMNYRLTYF